MFPKVAEDILIPYEWIELANLRWCKLQEEGFEPIGSCRAGVDVAGMGRDESVVCKRYGATFPNSSGISPQEKQTTCTSQAW